MEAVNEKSIRMAGRLGMATAIISLVGECVGAFVPRLGFVLTAVASLLYLTSSYFLARRKR